MTKKGEDWIVAGRHRRMYKRALQNVYYDVTKTTLASQANNV